MFLAKVVNEPEASAHQSRAKRLVKVP
jgi:hypothetical protein